MRRSDFVFMVSLCAGYPASNYRGPLHGMDKGGFDCSGFVGFVLRLAGFPQEIPRHANEMFDRFGFAIHIGCVLPGDLVFFSNRGGLYPDHVGIMISGKEYIHSPGRDGKIVCVSELEHSPIETDDPRQIYLANPIGFKRMGICEGRYQVPFLRD